MKSPDSGTEKNIGESAGEGKAGEKSGKHFHSSNSRRCKHATIDFRFCRLIARPRNANVIYMARRKGRSKNEGFDNDATMTVEQSFKRTRLSRIFERR